MPDMKVTPIRRVTGTLICGRVIYLVYRKGKPPLLIAEKKAA